MKSLDTIKLFSLVGLAAIGFAAMAEAQGPRVLPDGTAPADSRLGPLKDLNGYFPFDVPESADQWQKRAERVRRQVLVSQGLWPMPTRTPLEAMVHGRRDMGDYTVEKAYFQSLPGFYVTGNLYRPVGRSGRVPGVLCPHGHWSEGRFHDAGLAGVRNQIVAGGERFENGGRSPLQARCVQLARMGCVVFHYDMIGYADSQQISYELAHRFATQRPEMNRRSGWGLFSPQAESRLQSVMGLQTYGSIRAVDFLSELPDVDPSRIAVTGASGGGTQSFMLAAVDPRVAVSMPAVMVSTAMQGGCTCENACALRVHSGNIELAALFAPKPQGLTAADDWTKEMETKGFPELKRLYALVGAPDRVMLKPLTHFGHNYNYVSRAGMYSWFNKHLGLGLDEPIVEGDYERLGREEMTVWNEEHPRPPGGPDFERQLLAAWDADILRQLSAPRPEDGDSLGRYRDLVGPAVDVLVGRDLPPADAVEFDQKIKTDRGDYLEIGGLLRNKTHNEESPVVFLYPKPWEGRVVIWAHENGKQGLFSADGRPLPHIQALLKAGCSVAGVDLFMQGEFLTDGKPVETTRRVANPREAAAYTFGYNHSLFAQRVHDLLGLITYVRYHEYTPEHVFLVGLGDTAGPIAAAARAQARDAVTRAALDTGGFRFAAIDRMDHPQFLPGGARYDDLPGMLAIAAPAPLWLAGEGPEPPGVVQAAYRAAGAGNRAVTYTGDQAERDLVQWLIAGD